jgi:hypothetical protein
LVFIETYCLEEERVQQQYKAGERIVENLDEVKEQVKDSISLVGSLVSMYYVISYRSFTFAKISQAKGLRCNLVIWAATD